MNREKFLPASVKMPNNSNLYRCIECYALVHFIDTSRHAQWHKKQAAALRPFEVSDE